LKNEKNEKMKKFSSTRNIYLGKISYNPQPTCEMDGNPGRSKVSEGMSNTDNCGAAGTK
jgi:hypothetical protein